MDTTLSEAAVTEVGSCSMTPGWGRRSQQNARQELDWQEESVVTVYKELRSWGEGRECACEGCSCPPGVATNKPDSLHLMPVTVVRIRGS